MENIDKIWAEGSALFDYWQRVLDAELSKEFSSNQASNARRIAHDKALKQRAWQRAQTRLKASLVSGQIVAIGTPEDEFETRSLMSIEPNFWPSARLEPERNCAWLPGNQYTNIRVCESCDSREKAGGLNATVTTTELDEHSPPKQIPPLIELRPMAIEACFNQRLIDFDDNRPSERFKTYLTWIAERYPGCTIDQRGLGWKSFEADETKFKESNGLLRS